MDLTDSGKKTEQLGIKLPDAMHREFRLLAEEAGMSPQELVRSLISQHLRLQREKYHTLKSIFGDGAEISKVSGGIRGDAE